MPKHHIKHFMWIISFNLCSNLEVGTLITPFFKKGETEPQTSARNFCKEMAEQGFEAKSGLRDQALKH